MGAHLVVAQGIIRYWEIVNFHYNYKSFFEGLTCAFENGKLVAMGIEFQQKRPIQIPLGNDRINSLDRDLSRLTATPVYRAAVKVIGDI